jgi:hypothetical protein
VPATEIEQEKGKNAPLSSMGSFNTSNVSLANPQPAVAASLYEVSLFLLSELQFQQLLIHWQSRASASLKNNKTKRNRMIKVQMRQERATGKMYSAD